MLIGDKIKSLRKSKSITQAQLADALFVSAQSVSKWENHLSVPDITMLPVIARYFGITMDELFDYRLDALNYRERFIRFMVDNGMLRFGEYALKSGRKCPYYTYRRFYRMSSQISKLGEFYAECIRENGIETHCLVGIDDADTPLLIATSMTLFSKYGIDVEYQIENKHPSNKMTLLTDTFDSGNSIINALEKIKRETGVLPTDVVVSVDRKERIGNNAFSAKSMIEKKCGVRIHPIVDLDDIVRAIDSGVVSADGYSEKIKDYAEKYRGE